MTMGNTFEANILINKSQKKMIIVMTNGAEKQYDLSPDILFYPSGAERTEFEIKEEIIKRISPEEWRRWGFNATIT